MIRTLTQGVRKMAKNSNNVNMLQSIQQGYGNMTWGQKLSAAGTAYAGVTGYADAKNEGAGVPGALAQGVSDAFLMDLIGWKKYVGGAVLMGAGAAAIKGFEVMNSSARELGRLGTAAPFSSSTFVDSEQVYTMRQAGMNMIGQSQQSLRQTILGNEAQAMHR